MLFNKKAEEEFMNDFADSRQAAVDHPLLTGGAGYVRLAQGNSAPTRSVIDAWLTITGNLQSEGEVQVDGQIHGDIRCAHLTVGRDATVNGNITAEEVVVRGKVKGVIRANRVILQDSAHVESEIFHKKLSIEEGACFEGTSRRMRGSAESPKLRTQSPRARATASTTRAGRSRPDLAGSLDGGGRLVECGSWQSRQEATSRAWPPFLRASRLRRRRRMRHQRLEVDGRAGRAVPRSGRGRPRPAMRANAASIASAASSSSRSPRKRPVTCRPNGMPLLVDAAGKRDRGIGRRA